VQSTKGTWKRFVPVAISKFMVTGLILDTSAKRPSWSAAVRSVKG